MQSATDSAPSGTLTVLVSGIESNAGQLRFVLFDSKDSFLEKAVLAEVVAIDDGKGIWEVGSLDYGNYAVLVHHDLNSNGKMERHWYGKPKEPTGASNNPKPRMGPPRFKDTVFTLDSPSLAITITLNP